MRTLTLAFVTLASAALGACSDGADSSNDGAGGTGSGGDRSSALGTGGDGQDVIQGTAGDAGTGGSVGTGGTSTDGGNDGTGGDTSGALTGAFLMDDDGYVIFEAEDLSLVDGWNEETDQGPCGDTKCNPSEGAYITYAPSSLGDCSNEASAPSTKITVEFEVKETGFYRMAWRNWRDHVGHCEWDKNNDSFVAFPGAKNDAHFTQPFKVYGGGSDEWNWDANYDIHSIKPDKAKVCVELDAGVQEMTLSGRSNHHAIDRVAIFKAGSSVDECRNAGVGGLDDRANTGRAE